MRDNFPVLVAQVDGIEVRLKFDLGDSDHLALQQSVLDHIKAAPTGEVAKFKGVYGEFESPLYKVTRLQIGTDVFTDVIARLDVRDPSYRPGEQGEKGYLGTGLLKSHLLVLNYPDRSMTLVPQARGESSTHSCAGTAVPFSPKWKGEPVTEAGTDLGQVLLWWDTGSPVSALRKYLVDDKGAQSVGDSITSNRLVLGARDYGPVQFHVWDMNLPGFDGFIGYNFFAEHLVCVDFAGNRLLVGP